MFSLRLQNYKSFLDAEVQLSKINILIGPNNSGKSAFLKFLLMLKQSMFQNNHSSKLDYILNGNLVDLGRFEDIVYYGQKEKKLNFTIGWDSQGLMIGHISKNDKKLLSHNYINGITFDIMPNGSCSTHIIEYLGKKHEFKLNEISEISEIKINTGFLKIEQFRKKENESLGVISTSLFGNLPLQINQATVFLFLRYLKYINPLHSSPERIYNKRDDKGIQDIRDLNDVIYFLADSSIEKEKKEALVSKLNEMVRFLGIAKELKLMQAENIPAMQLWVKISEDEFWNNIKDVGYGLSMQLPMLLQSLISEVEGGEWLLFEQPEIHIYPRLQAKFIEAITTLGPNNNYIIETHSDIMVKKLQAMVKNGQLKAEDVAIHYFDRKSEQTIVTRHSVLEDGTLDVPLPEDFYDNSTDLILELLK